MRYVVVELVGGICNAHCAWCFLSYKCRDKMKKGMMSRENFAKFIDINKKAPFSLIPFGHGESLLNKDFPVCYRYALDNGFSLHSVHTNLALPLTAHELNALSWVNTITVNLGGGTKETHKLNMGTDFDLVISNLKRLLEFGPKKVIAKMVLNKHNWAEKCEFMEVIEEIDSSIIVEFYPIYFGPADSDQEDKKLFYERNLEKIEHLFCREDVTINNGEVIVRPRFQVCYGLIPTVRWNGSVSICCRERYHEKSVGDAFKKPMKKIVKSEEYRDARRLGKKRQWVKYCRRCS